MNKFRERRIDSKRREYAQLANQEKRKRRRKKNYIIHYILVFILVTVIGTILSLTVFFNINKIIIDGNSELKTKEEIVGYTNVSVGDNLFRIDIDKIENRILNNTTDIDAVKVQRGLPDRLVVKLTPSVPKLAYFNNGSYHLISGADRVITTVDNLEKYPDIIKFTSENLKDIKVGEFLSENETYQEFKKVMDSISSSQIQGVKAIEIKKDGEIKLNYQDRITVELGNTIELDYKLKTVKKVIEEHIDKNAFGIIDAKTETVAYFRPMSYEKQKESGKTVKIE